MFALHTRPLMLSGTVEAKRVRCGRANCRCQADPAHAHGPYHYLVHRTSGGARSRLYIPPHLLPEVQRLVQVRQAQEAARQESRRTFERLYREARQLLRDLEQEGATPR